MIRMEFEGNILFIDSPGTTVSLHAGSLAVMQGKKTKLHVPLKNLQSVIIACKGVALSSDFLLYCANNGLSLEVLNERYQHSGSLIGSKDNRIALWRTQMEAMTNERGVKLATAFVKGKIKNQRSLLLYYGKYHRRHNPEFQERLEEFLRVYNLLIKELEDIECDNIDTLRGHLFAIEGRAGMLYWDCVSKLLKKELIFPGRVKKGAKDPVNVMLNYGYGLLYTVIYRNILSVGLNPYIGYLHKTDDTKAVLVYDFIEEFRQSFVDKIVFALAGRGYRVQLRDNQLPREARQKLIREFTKRLTSNTYYRGRHCSAERIITLQARQLKTFITSETKEYIPFVSKW